MARKGSATFWDQAVASGQAASTREARDLETANEESRAAARARLEAAELAAGTAPSEFLADKPTVIRVPSADPTAAAAEKSLRDRKDAATKGIPRSGFAEGFTALGSRSVPVRNRAYEPTKKHLDTTKGLVERQVPEQQAVFNAELDRARAETVQLRRYADEQDSLLVQQRANEIARAERERQEVDNIREANRLANKATAEYVRSNQLDPSKAWKKKGLGMKIIAVLAAGLKGFAGRSNPTSHIDDVIHQELEAQKGNIQIAGESMHQARANVGEAHNIYREMLEKSGNERQADAVWTLGRLQAIKDQAAAMLHEAGVGVLAASQHPMMTQLEMRVAEQRRIVDLGEIGNTKMKMVRVGPSADQREMIKYGMKKEVDEGYKQNERAHEMGIEGMKSDAAARTAEVEARRRDLRGPHGVVQEASEYTNRTEKPYAVKMAIDRLFDMFPEGGDLPGVGYGGRKWMNWGDDAKASQQFDLIQQLMGRGWSGGAITEDEERQFADLIMGGSFLGGDDRVRSNLTLVKNKMDEVLEYHKRPLTPEARVHLFGDLAPKSAPFRDPGYVNTPDPAAAREDR